MFCPNCGTQNADGAKFCSGCGNTLTPDVNAAPVQPQAPYAAPAQPVAPITAMPPQKTNVLCIVGLITSLASIIFLGTTSLISLILSVIGLINAGKKNERGKGQAIAGIIISSVLLVSILCGVIFGLSDLNRSRRRYDDPPRRTTEDEDYTERTTRETTERTTRETTTEETTRETTEETESTTSETSASESKTGLYMTSVGNTKTGTVPLTSGKWIEFREAGGFSSEVVEHQQAEDISTRSIIGLFVLKTDRDPEEIGKAQMASMDQAGAKNITGARVKIGGYNAVQCYGTYPDGVILVCWYFRGDDGLVRKITVEFPSNNTYAFKMVEDGYKLDR